MNEAPRKKETICNRCLNLEGTTGSRIICIEGCGHKFYNEADSDWRKFIGEVLGDQELYDFIWERCEADDHKTKEILEFLKAKLLGGE